MTLCYRLKAFLQTDDISTLSLEEVVGDKHDFPLQNVDPSFTDSTEDYFTAFKKKSQANSMLRTL
jgi:hypothetical protein